MYSCRPKIIIILCPRVSLYRPPKTSKPAEKDFESSVSQFVRGQDTQWVSFDRLSKLKFHGDDNACRAAARAGVLSFRVAEESPRRYFLIPRIREEEWGMCGSAPFTSRAWDNMIASLIKMWPLVVPNSWQRGDSIDLADALEPWGTSRTLIEDVYARQSNDEHLSLCVPHTNIEFGLFLEALVHSGKLIPPSRSEEATKTQ
jgi:hypothetical protein